MFPPVNLDFTVFIIPSQFTVLPLYFVWQTKMDKGSYW